MFDAERGKINHTKGKITNDDYNNLYVSGWLKRGPSGIIGTNIVDAKETVDTIMNDLLQSSSKKSKHGRDELLTILKERNVDVVDWDMWCKISEEEIKRGKIDGRVREKIVDVNDMLHVAHKID